MFLHYRTLLYALLFTLLFAFQPQGYAQFIPVGDGSYTTTFPGVDAAGRNSFPSGTPQLSENALGKPVPTNDWWSLLIKNDHAGNLFNYPMALKTVNSGLVVSYIPWGVYDDQEPIIIGLSGLNASKATVADYSDWTVTMDWNDGTHHLQATSGIAMPFLYFNKDTDDDLQVTVNLGDVTISGEMLMVANARNDADFVLYAPTGSTWIQNGNTYSSTLNGKNYWSMAMLPQSTSTVATTAEEYKKYAYVFPTNTTVHWNYDESNSTLQTDFEVETSVKEGTETNVLMGLLPHQWANLAANSPQPNQHTYSSVRGDIKTLDGNSFSVTNTFYGILPTLPYLSNYSNGFSVAALKNKIELLENDGLSAWTDSYNEGQMMNRLIQTARIAHEAGNVSSRDKIIDTIKERLENWLTAETNEVAFLFYYHDDWSAMLGYPAGHGQDNNINDHHFHWGYFIHAAAFLEQFEPGWANQWGEMVNHLVRDAASASRSDDKFPFLRNFSPYAGHCWANGFATFPQGNDQESTSESMQFNSSLIHWGTITGNDEIRDLGIYLYTTEQTAIEEYWFDMHERNFAASQPYSLVSRVWGNSYDNGTFWTNDIAASYGIELYPIHGGSLYLGHHTDYVQKLWTEIESNTGILSNQANVNLWHDVMWEYLAFIDPEKAIQLYDSYPDRSLKFGVSDAQTYYWLHAMNALGQVDISITANYPIATVFNKAGDLTYVAHNYTDDPITVLFSDGFSLDVPANSMATSKDINISSTLSTSFTQAHTNGSVDLNLNITSGSPTKVVFYKDNELLGELTNAPYVFKADQLTPGIHNFYAKVYEGDKLGVSNVVTVIVGNQEPFGGSAAVIPGIIEAGNYDIFEGGLGQGIAYSDASAHNEGDYRSNEAVDAVLDANEGATVGWIASGEWLEYTIDVQSAGLYQLDFRYASGNNNGGGPFQLVLDGQVISDPITVNYTGDWNDWATKTIENLPIASGQHLLRLAFEGGEFNIGKMTFTYQAELPYSQPIANAGENVLVLLPQSTANLDGTASADPDNGNLTFAWEQIYGPSVITFSDAAIATPQVSGLTEGIYRVKLTVDNGSYTDDDELLIIVSSSPNLAPTVSISSPKNNDEFIAGKPFDITAIASDLDGSIAKVDFYADGQLIGSKSSAPYTINWTTAIGAYDLSATATDNDGNTANSPLVRVILNQPPSCQGTAHNGDFDYVFSDDSSNPTLTFIPSISGVGSPTCILYYGTSANGPYPGYGVTPNQPFTLSADEGSTIYFYYTYSYPNQGEKNTADHVISYVVGSCVSGVVASLEMQDKNITLDENSTEGTAVTSMNTTYSGTKSLTYSILSGNSQGAFQIHAQHGDLSVADVAPLDFETTPSFTLEIQVTDGDLTDQATITIQLNDLDEGVLGVHPELANISVYPNPITNHLVIDWDKFKSATIYSLLGNQLLTSKQATLNLARLPSGLYILQLNGRNQELVQLKVVKK